MRADRPPRFLTPWDRFVRWRRARRLHLVRASLEHDAPRPIVARGARHVRWGLSILGVAGTLPLLALLREAVHRPSLLLPALAGVAIGGTFLAALHHGNAIARALAAVGSILGFFAVLGLTGVAVAVFVPSAFFAAIPVAVVTMGLALASLTPAADAWHEAQAADRRRRRTARTLEEWRSAGAEAGSGDA